MINGQTVIYGLMGHPVGHSFSPAMHNAALAGLGLNAVYVPFDPPPDQLQAAVAGIRALGVAGVNVTVPYKEAVIPFLDELSAEAQSYGAVNTIVHRRGILTGHNTDGAGFIRALQEDAGFHPARGKTVILGAGGAARAVALALAGQGCPELVLVNRRPERAAQLAALVSAATGALVRACPWSAGAEPLATAAREAVLLVNCTPAGMSGGGDGPVDWPLPRGVPGPGQLACDLVYNPPWTPFLKRAAAQGAWVRGGLGMLLYQGVLALELWTGGKAPVDIMRRALLEQAGEWI